MSSATTHAHGPAGRRTATVAAAALVVTGAVAGSAHAAPPTAPYVSEIHYDNAGADVGELLEVHLPPGTTSAGLQVVLYNGNNGTVYDTDPVPAVTAPSDAPAVALVTYPSNGIQNGAPDGVALVGPAGVIELLSWEGTLTAADGPAAGMTSTDIGVAETGSEAPGLSLSRTYDVDTDALVWHGPAPATPGTVNPLPSDPDPGGTEVCTLPTTHEIGQVQGSGGSTPLAGEQVTVRGVVVGDLPGFSGFYLQDPDGDGDAATSDGVFVFSPVDVALGDTVAVQGEAGEFSGQTQIVSSQDVAVCTEGSEADLPAPAPLDLPSTDAEREPLEGMLVVPVDTLTVSEVFDLTSFGELTLSEGGLLVQPTEVAEPGAAADAVAQENARRRIVLDDGVTARVSVTTRPYLGPDTPVRVGDELTFTSPLVLGFGFGQFRLQPADGTAVGTFAPQDTRPAQPDDVGGDVQVAAFNVLNYFLTFSGPDARGADSAAELDLQAAKIVTAIEALDAEVVTLMEIEDTEETGYSASPDEALADLVARLNTDAGYEKWAYVPLPDELLAVDRDAIRNGIIYQPGEVEPLGDPVGLVDETVWFNAREPLAQTFTADGDAFTVVANHFKSKSPGEPTGDNVDSGDGQGAWNGDRTRQAESLLGFAQFLQQTTGDPDVLLMGDFNAYSMEDPIDVLVDGGFVDLGTLLDPGRYSYVFDDQSGSLDHALASEEMVSKVTDLAHWNVNAVESFAYQYSGDPALYAPHAYRSSDHDPIVLGIDLAERCGGLVPTIVGTDGDDVLRGTNGKDVIMGLGGDDVIRGGNAEDVVCGGSGTDLVEGGNGEDLLVGGPGDDRLLGGNGDDELLGGSGDDDLRGGNGDDVLVGGPGDDSLDQGNGRGSEEQGGRPV